MKNKTMLFSILLTFNLYNCKINNDTILIKPIDKELNKQLLTGKGLDLNFFSSMDVIQYYTIKNYPNFLTINFISKIKQFIIKQYSYKDIIKKKQVIISLYKEKFLGYSHRSLYESARDNEFGGIEGCSEYLICKIIFENRNSSNKEFAVCIVYYNEKEIESEYITKLVLK